MADHYGRLTSTPKVASILLAMARRVKMKTLLPDENVVTWSWYFELLWSKDTLQFLWSTKGFWPISDPYSPKIEVDISDAPKFFFSLSQFSSKLFSFLTDGSELQEDCDSHCSIHSFMKVKQNYIYTTKNLHLPWWVDSYFSSPLTHCYRPDVWYIIKVLKKNPTTLECVCLWIKCILVFNTANVFVGL